MYCIPAAETDSACSFAAPARATGADCHLKKKKQSFPDLPKLSWTGRRSGPALWPSASLFKVALSISGCQVAIPFL
jgi:hypothetical protein